MLLKKIIPAILCFVICTAAFSQGDRVNEYIDTYKELAIKEMIRTGVPAAITLAQGILESQSGESKLAKRSNNHFGIKCKNDWTGGRVYHDDDARGECFRSYADPEQSYMDHSDFLKTRAHYAFLFNLDPTDYEGWAKGLKKAGYATNPTYAQKLIGIIERYNLQEYTHIAINRSKEQPDDLLAYSGNEEANVIAKEVDGLDSVKHPEEENRIGFVSIEGVQQEPEEEASVIKPAVTIQFKATDYPESPFTINGVKVIFAKEGTSLLSLANEFGIAYKKLLEFNEIEASSSDILTYDQLVFLAKKSKKGNRDIHTVQAGETMEVIAQKEGVLLEALLAFNRIPKGRQPVMGEKIYLKANSPVTPKLVAATANK